MNIRTIPERPVISDNITRRRFIKRTGAATVASALAFNSLRVYGAIISDCMCFTFTAPAGGFPFTVPNPLTVAPVKNQLKNKNVPYNGVDCATRRADIASGTMRIDSVPQGTAVPDPVDGVITFPAGTTWQICVHN